MIIVFVQVKTTIIETFNILGEENHVSYMIEMATIQNIVICRTPIMRGYTERWIREKLAKENAFKQLKNHIIGTYSSCTLSLTLKLEETERKLYDAYQQIQLLHIENNKLVTQNKEWENLFTTAMMNTNNVDLYSPALSDNTSTSSSSYLYSSPTVSSSSPNYGNTIDISTLSSDIEEANIRSSIEQSLLNDEMLLSNSLDYFDLKNTNSSEEEQDDAEEEEEERGNHKETEKKHKRKKESVKEEKKKDLSKERSTSIEKSKKSLFSFRSSDIKPTSTPTSTSTLSQQQYTATTSTTTTTTTSSSSNGMLRRRVASPSVSRSQSIIPSPKCQAPPPPGSNDAPPPPSVPLANFAPPPPASHNAPPPPSAKLAYNAPPPPPPASVTVVPTNTSVPISRAYSGSTGSITSSSFVQSEQPRGGAPFRGSSPGRGRGGLPMAPKSLASRSQDQISPPISQEDAKSASLLNHISLKKPLHLIKEEEKDNKHTTKNKDNNNLKYEESGSLYSSVECKILVLTSSGGSTNVNTTIFKDSEQIGISIINKYTNPIYLFLHIHYPNGTIKKISLDPLQGTYMRLLPNSSFQSALGCFKDDTLQKDSVSSYKIRLVITTNGEGNSFNNIDDF